MFRRLKELLWGRLEPGPKGLDVKAERESVDYIDQPVARLEQGTGIRKRAEGRLAFVTQKKDKLQEEARRSIDSTMAPADDAVRLLRTLTVASVLLLLLGVPLQAIVNMIAIASLMGWRLWAVSVVVDLGLAAFTKTAALAAFRDPIRPRLVTKRCLTGAAVTGAASGGALTLLALSRTASGELATLLLDIVPICLWVLAEGLPITAGFLLAAMEILSSPFDREHDIAELAVEEAEVNDLIAWLVDDGKRCVEKLGSASVFGAHAGSGNGGAPDARTEEERPGLLVPRPEEGGDARGR